MTKNEFVENCKLINIDFNDELLNKLNTYYNLLVEWNNKFNMTAITNEEDVYLLHFYDSLCMVKALDLNKYSSLLDFGTGAGFPGMILGLFFNNLNVTLIESNNKKCTFLNEVKNQLGLDNVTVICDRVENYALKNREKFDIVTCRAVTSIPMIIELATACVKVYGYLAPLKSDCSEELSKYSYLNKEFNLKLINTIKYNLPFNNAVRNIPLFQKISVTDKKYPRNYSAIVKKYKLN